MSRSRVRPLPVLAAALVLLAAVPLGAAYADPDPPAAPTPDASPTPAQGRPTPIFVTHCAYVHSLMDDPIVHPGQPGASHLHDFFANTTTSAASTADSLLQGTTTCRDRGETAAYWTPSLLVNGLQVAPSHFSAYYQARRPAYDSIQPFPAGLKMIAGDSMATAAQPLEQVRWTCAGDPLGASATIPTCPGPALQMHVRFPNCWDGANLDSADHKSHMAYAARGVCPADHPVPVPSLQVNVTYPVTGGPGVELASGGQYSGHADFVNAWNQDELGRLVTSCIDSGLGCRGQ